MGMSFSLIIILSDLIVHPERCMVPQKDTMLLNTTRRVPPLPVTGDSCGYRRTSTGNNGWFYGAMGGTPCCPDAGVGDPPS